MNGISIRHNVGALLQTLALFGMAIAAAPAQADALRGKTLYATVPTGTPAAPACANSACHKADPTLGTNKINNGANNAALISSAISGNTGGMGKLVGKWTATDLTDIALYIANPSVSAGAVAAIAPASIAFAGTVVGVAATAQQVTLSNTGGANLTITSISVAGTNIADFAPVTGSCAAGGTVAPAASCTVSVGFTPTAVGARAATLTVVHSVGQSVVNLSGTGTAAPQPSLNLNFGALSFGSVPLTTSSTKQTVTVTNGGQAPLTLSAITVSGVAAGVFATSGTCALNVPIAVARTCTVDLVFSPGAIGTVTGTLGFTSNAANSGSVTLTGTGAAAPAPVVVISPASVAFGNQTSGGTSGTQIVTLQNTGNALATIGVPSLSGSTMFSMVNANACGTSLAAGASCSLQLQFKPTAASAQTANLQVSSNAPGSPHQVTLSGTGVTQATPTPVLSQSAVFAFADTTVAQRSSAFTATASNTGAAAYKVTQVLLDGLNPADFALGGSCAPLGAAQTTVSPGSTCTLTVSFAPTVIGLRQARANLVTDSGSTLGFVVQGIGTAVATSSGQVGALAFGIATLNTASAPMRSNLVNTGNQNLTITNIATAAPFTLVADATTCASGQFTLVPGQQCAIQVIFTPTVAGAVTGNLTVNTAAAGLLVLHGNLTGTGAAALVVPATTSGGTGTTGATTTGATPSAVSAASGSGDIPSNVGAGGCTMSRDGNDVSMLLLLLATFVTAWRRRSIICFSHKESS